MDGKQLPVVRKVFIQNYPEEFKFLPWIWMESVVGDQPPFLSTS